MPWADLSSPPHCERNDVSYQSRQKKRRHKRTEAKARQRRSSESARSWFLTLAKQPGKYMCCRDRFERGAEIVYRHEPRAVRCVRCAERLEDSRGFRTSIRWERKQRVAQ
jgi:ribosomal protein S27E